MASSLLRSAGCALRRSVATQSFSRRPARSLVDNRRLFSSDAAGGTEKSKLPGSKLNMERRNHTEETRESLKRRINMKLDKLLYTKRENAQMVNDIRVGLQEYRESMDREKLQRKALVRLSVLVALAYGAKRTLFD